MRIEPAVPAENLAAIRAPLAAAGAQAIDAPLVQPLGLTLDLAGEAMRARLFVVQAEGGAESCLRPDFTVAVARRHIERGARAGRYLYEGSAFRASPDGTQPEEFRQLGLELFTEASDPVAADVEAVILAWRAAEAGGRDDLTLWLGDVGLFAAFIQSLSLTPALSARLARIAGRPRLLQAELSRAGADTARPEPSPLAAMLADLSEDKAGALLVEMWALAGVEPVGGRAAGEIAARLVRKAEVREAPALTQGQAEAVREFMAISAAPAAGLARVRELAGRQAPALDAALGGWEARLSQLPVGKVQFAPALGHAFDYYDGLTFEVRSAALGADRPVAAGGRYDGLLARLGGASGGGAVGCMVRPWRAFAGGQS
jgi:ATP phosphoribosyltransferase regulatory subunit